MRFVLIGVLLVAPGAALAQPRAFEPGHIFIVERFDEGCWVGNPEHILGIDPETLETWVFADQEDGLCGPTGLVFTPDGTRLRASQWALNQLFDFTEDGAYTVVYGSSDQLRSPANDNGMGFDGVGNFYCMNNSLPFRLLMFPADSSPPIVLGDVDDGLREGGIAVAADGTIYCAGGEVLVKVTRRSDGQVTFTPFRDYGPNESSVCATVGSTGDLYVGVDFAPNPGAVFKYAGADPAREELFVTLVGDFGSGGGPHFTMALSPDDLTLYVSDQRRLYAIDTTAPPPREPAVIYAVPDYWASSNGLAVYRGPQPVRSPGDLNCDGTVNQFDINPFILALSDADEYAQTFPACDVRLADTNADGSVNQFDIQPFVELLTPQRPSIGGAVLIP